MSKIIINVPTTYQAEVAAKALLSGGFNARTAFIKYNLKKGLPLENALNEYPLILSGRLASIETNVYINTVTAGYGGSGSHALVDILKAAGFEFDEKDILTSRLEDSNGLIHFELVK